MDIKWVVFGVVLVINTVFALSVAAFIARKLIVPGRNSLVFVLISLAIWSFAYAMITFSTRVEIKQTWLRVENIGIVSQPVLWFVFIVSYARQTRFLKWPFIAVLCLIPAISLIMIFSDQWFHLYYTSIKPLAENGGPLVIERAPWYWMELTQSYALNAIGTVFLISRFIEFRNIFRKQLAFLIAAVLIPLIVNIVYQLISNLRPSFFIPVDLTPISFTVSIWLISLGIFRTNLLDLVPITRDVIMEHIPEMVFVVDAHDRVLDANNVAEKWLGKSRHEMIGHDPMEVFKEWPELINRFLSTEKTREEVQISGTPPLMLEVVITPLYTEQTGELNGRIILAYDITERKQLENELKNTNKILMTKIFEVEFLKEKLQEQAIRDPLTGVFNRRFLAESLDKEVSKAERENTPVSIIMMDVDFFKTFNDSYGHKCGDIVLQDLANFLTENSRQGDIVCRYGGEEFVILMPNATLHDAYERAETWRQTYSAKSIRYAGNDLSICFSAGVANFP
ncbi:MAG: histidine kinase N-terminal 7TM domain-containing protein, partial [Anaerolineales bacterium]|nr:histidine kinase N-terminal 7TM domain-containing protein [Anaerolineales bacterium]